MSGRSPGSRRFASPRLPDQEVSDISGDRHAAYSCGGSCGLRPSGPNRIPVSPTISDGHRTHHSNQNGRPCAIGDRTDALPAKPYAYSRHWPADRLTAATGLRLSDAVCQKPAEALRRVQWFGKRPSRGVYPDQLSNSAPTFATLRMICCEHAAVLHCSKAASAASAFLPKTRPAGPPDGRAFFQADRFRLTSQRT